MYEPTVKLAQDIRDWIHAETGEEIALSINSGLRCEDHNAAQGGAPNSRHLTGRAIDIRFSREPDLMSSRARMLIVKAAVVLGAVGIICDYRSFVHLDMRYGPAIMPLSK